jgi:DNA-binding CsgD family transcriptional regulator
MGTVRQLVHQEQRKHSELSVWDFSALLFKQQSLLDSCELAEFQRQLLASIKDSLSFESAIWCSGRLEFGRLREQMACLYKTDSRTWKTYRRVTKGVQHLTTVAQPTGERVINVNISANTIGSRQHPGFARLLRRSGVAHILATVVIDPRTDMVSIIVLVRTVARHAFLPDECALMQALTPHLIALWDRKCKSFLCVRQRTANNGMAAALCDAHGFVNHAQVQFEDFMRVEWPRWQGRLLPMELFKSISRGKTTRFTGSKVKITCERVGDMYLLTVTKKSALDELSTRELEIARLYGKGLDVREIARVLFISPVTVRNHVQAIYQKLSVDNKVELALLLNKDVSVAD